MGAGNYEEMHSQQAALPLWVHFGEFKKSVLGFLFFGFCFCFVFFCLGKEWSWYRGKKVQALETSKTCPGSQPYC